MSNDKQKLSFKLENGKLYGYIGRKPELKQGKKAIYTKFSFYDNRLAEHLNPVQVTAFNEAATTICEVCKDFDTKTFIELHGDILSLGTVFNKQTKQSRDGVFFIATSCKQYVKPDEEISDEQSTTTDNSEQANNQDSKVSETALQTAVTLLVEKGVNVNADS